MQKCPPFYEASFEFEVSLRGTKWAEGIKYDPSFCTGVQFYEMEGTEVL